MGTLSNWFIRNPVAANLIMMLVLVGGIFTLFTIRIEGFPKIPPNTIEISTQLIGAQTHQIDAQITRKIEKALEGLDGVKSVQSQSSPGYSYVAVQKTSTRSIQRLLDDVRLRIDGVSDLPDAATRPVIKLNEFSLPALYIQIYGETDPDTLQILARRLQDDLLARPEVSKLELWGIRAAEVSINVLPHMLERHDLTIADIVTKIQQSSLRFQAGTLKTAGGNIVLRADDLAVYGNDYRTIHLKEYPNGSSLLLGDIATIKDGYGDEEVFAKFNGQPTVGIVVMVAQRENLLTIAKAVRSVADIAQTQLPPNVKIAVWGDSSGYISDRLNLLSSNALQGLLLVALMLALFLNVRLAFWVAMGIPISIAGGIFVAGSKWVDYSLNDVTTFGLIIALGILVDDAVVVGESIFEERAKEKDPIIGTEKGLEKVAVATVFGVLTTIAAFFPMLLIDNALGKVLASFSGIVILALLFSLLESKFILPAHLAHIPIGKKPARNPISHAWGKVQTLARAGLKLTRDRIYQPTLIFAIAHRYAVVLVFAGMAALGIGAMVSGKLKMVFFPDIPGQIITINLEMDARAPGYLTRDHMGLIEKTGQELNTEFQEEFGLDNPPITHFFLSVSSNTSAQIYAELTLPEERPNLTIIQILNAWQSRVGRLEGISELTFSGTEDVAGGFQLRLFSKDDVQLQDATDAIRTYLESINGVSNIRDTLKGGKPELSLKLKPEARRLGFTTETLARQVGHIFGGTEAQRLQRGSQEVRVVVQSADEARNTIADLFQTRLRSETGIWVPLQSIADVESRYVAGTISRRNGKRSNVISVVIDRTQVSPNEVYQSFAAIELPRLQELYPQVEITTGGELTETEEIKGGLIRALIITALIIYVLMAIPLKSYAQPIVILSVVPFGFVGAAVGHLIADVPLSLLSFFGMLALTGVVVNDSLVMVTKFNQNRESGMPLIHAVTDCGIGRFQAIFLTTATTVVGLLPLLNETSEQAQYLIPAAISLAYGEIFATAITLILIPVLIMILSDLQKIIHPVSSQRLENPQQKKWKTS